MTKVVFSNRIRSFLLVMLFGIIGGALVGFFEQFPHDDLWAFALFGSQTIGFWMCTTSLIVLFSEKFYSAGINAFLYIFFMFYVTGIFKRLAMVQKGFADWPRFWNGFLSWGEYAYAGLWAAVCFLLGMVLWLGRKRKVVFVILRFLPALFILTEAIHLWSNVAQKGIGLFMALVDTVCLIVFILIIVRASCLKGVDQDKNETKKTETDKR